MSTLISPPDVATRDEPESAVRSRSSRAPGYKTVVIVGHGMVGHRLCQEIRRRPELAELRIVAIGDEPCGAYDRVHLARVLQGQDPEVLRLGAPDFYETENIQLILGDPVVAIERAAKTVLCASGRQERYDHLVLCTGAAPVLGKIPGIDGPRVRPLRTAEDAVLIRERAQEARLSCRPVVIIGGGLLGLELAHELTELGCEVDVLEGADYPLSRQLEKGAGDVLGALIGRPGLRLHLGCRVAQIVDSGDALEVKLADERTFPAALVVPAMGIRPRDQLAREAGLACDLFGGVEVSDELLTRDKNISAIGECARHRGVVYGIVAPGYAMAEQVARRLAGQPGKFRGVHVGTRLKVPGVLLSVLGESSATGLGVKSLVYQEAGVYRRLAVRRGRIIGIVSLGEWQELPRAQDALARAERLRAPQFHRFEKAERIWSGLSLSLREWPDAATVCTCMGVTCGALKALAEEGCTTVDELSRRSSAGTVCGTCKSLLATLCDASPSKDASPSGWMLWLSVASMLGALAFPFLPAFPVPETVIHPGLDVLWANQTLKQVTGFCLVGMFSLSILFSARKRLARFQFGEFQAWRVVHAALGLLCLLGAFLHTGFRLGEGLDRGLVLVFLGSTFLGGVSGGYTLLLGLVPPSAATRLRAWLVRSHIYLLWPLPVLVGFHVAKVYFF